MTVPAHSHHLWQLGGGLPFCTFPTQRVQALRCIVACFKAFMRLQPHTFVTPDNVRYGPWPVSFTQSADHIPLASQILAAIGQAGLDQGGASVILGFNFWPEEGYSSVKSERDYLDHCTVYDKGSCFAKALVSTV